MRRALIAGNWKMNMLRGEALALADALAGMARRDPPPVDLLVCPPSLHVAGVAAALAHGGIAVGAQDCHAAAHGAHTGDVSAPMLADAGATHVIVGHSERRMAYGETSALVRAKAAAAHAAGLTALICIGETQEQRALGATLDVVGGQLLMSVPDGATAANTAIAYEPVWAIGSGRVPTAAEVAEVHDLIRTRLAGRFVDGADFRVLYGGSMKPDNAASLMAIPGVDGGLIGGASLKAEDFWAIAQAGAG